uniref:Putative secreted mucin n=1 Tax=Amblyomma parvum TaxID=251391 RepID=A0A023G0D2_AMBPA
MAKTPGISWLQLPVLVLLLINHLHPALANEQRCEGESCVNEEGGDYPVENGQGSSSPSGLAVAEAVAGGIGDIMPQRPYPTQQTPGTPDHLPSSTTASTKNGRSKSTGTSQKSSAPSPTPLKGSNPKKASAATSKSSGMSKATPSKTSSTRVASFSNRSPPRLQARPAAKRMRRKRGR